MKYICSCGTTSSTSFCVFKKGSRCRSCGRTKSSKKQKLPFIVVQEFFRNTTCTLLSDEADYTNIDSLLSYTCDCGRNAASSFSNFKAGCRCYECGLQKRKRFGKDHPNWNANRAADLRERESPQYKKWRQQIFEKDGYTCQNKNCLKHKHTLHAHHIINFSTNKDKRLCVKNGVTLCVECHITFHQIYGNKKNNEYQLKEFFNKIIRKEERCLNR